MLPRIASLVDAAHLLIACDFDGTLAPIVPRRDAARPLPELMDVLELACRVPNTSVAVLSGRSMADLKRALHPPPEFWLASGHGAAITGPEFDRPVKDVSLLLEAIGPPLERTAPEGTGFVLERKPAGFAVHFREADIAERERVLTSIVDTIAEPAGLRVLKGKMVLELLATEESKGSALQTIQQSAGATATLYVGDDHSDEEAFQVLGPADLGIKIGPPPTDAHFTAGSMHEVHDLIRHVMWKRASRFSPRAE